MYVKEVDGTYSLGAYYHYFLKISFILIYEDCDSPPPSSVSRGGAHEEGGALVGPSL